MARTGEVRLRVTRQQKELLESLAETHGYTTLSDYCRSKLFEEFSIHNKLNKILERLQGQEDQDDIRTR